MGRNLQRPMIMCQFSVFCEFIAATPQCLPDFLNNPYNNNNNNNINRFKIRMKSDLILFKSLFINVKMEYRPNYY